jgi:hypothetical protein
MPITIAYTPPASVDWAVYTLIEKTLILPNTCAKLLSTSFYVQTIELSLPASAYASVLLLVTNRAPIQVVSMTETIHTIPPSVETLVHFSWDIDNWEIV